MCVHDTACANVWDNGAGMSTYSSLLGNWEFLSLAIHQITKGAHNRTYKQKKSPSRNQDQFYKLHW